MKNTTLRQRLGEPPQAMRPVTRHKTNAITPDPVVIALMARRVERMVKVNQQ